MSGELKVAVVGCGRMGAYTRPELRERLSRCWLPLNHAEGVKSVQGLELSACCDIDQAAAVAAGQRYGVQQVFTDYTEMIRQVQPDILTIATRTEGRADIIRFAAENGVRGIHAEKPLCRNMAEAKSAVAAMEKNGVAFSYGTLRRYMSVYRRAREIVLSGEIGQLVQVIVKHGRTTLLWNHPHSVDLLLFFAKATAVEYVQASLSVRPDSVAGSLVDDDPIVENGLVRFSNGVSGLITAASGLSVVASCTEGEVSVIGDGAWIELAKCARGKAGPYYQTLSRLHEACDRSGLQVALEELRDVVNKARAADFTINDALLGQKILLGFVRSHLDGGTRRPLQAVDDTLTVTGRQGSLYA
jgi:scyllo-inositol 2-dehydrogenase (NAD+)